MNTTEKIYSKIKKLPESTQQEVLNYVEYLLSRVKFKTRHPSKEHGYDVHPDVLKITGIVPPEVNVRESYHENLLRKHQ